MYHTFHGENRMETCNLARKRRVVVHATMRPVDVVEAAIDSHQVNTYRVLQLWEKYEKVSRGRGTSLDLKR